MAIAHTNYGNIIRRRWSFVALITLIVMALTVGFTVLMPFEYESQVKILVIQKSSLGIDAYSASKSAERVGSVVGQVIYSSSFFSEVMHSGFPIDEKYFKADEEKRRQQWRDMIATGVPAGTTILNVSAFHVNRDQATNIAKAIAYVVQTSGTEYIGISDVEFKVLDEPLTSNYPVRPNFILNTILGCIVGLVIAIATLLITYTEDPVAHELFHHGRVVSADDAHQQRSARPIPSLGVTRSQPPTGSVPSALPTPRIPLPEDDVARVIQIKPFADNDKITVMPKKDSHA